MTKSEIAYKLNELKPQMYPYLPMVTWYTKKELLEMLNKLEKQI